MPEFLFAYGSLIGSESHNLAGGTATRVPARVTGLRRGWFLSIPEDRDMGLGAVFHEGGTCNGIVLELNTSGISAADGRETQHGYSRVQLPNETISTKNRAFNECDKVWVYITNQPEPPSADFPIAQSYVDVVLSGCMEIGHEFAMEFIATTHGWEYPWIDDRKAPRYRRAKSADRQQIDEILKQVIPKELSHRKKIPEETRDT